MNQPPSPGSAAPTLSTSSYRWALLGALWLLYFCFGLVFASMAPLIQPITSDLRISHTQMGIILAAWTFVYIAAAIPIGIVVDRFSSSWVLCLGGAVMALSALARGLAQDEISMFLAVALFGLGGATVSIGAPKLVAQWFSSEGRGAAMGIYITGPALGSAAALSLTHSVFMPALGEDWRAIMFLHAAFTLLASLVWFAIASHPKADDGRTSGSERISFNLQALRQILAANEMQFMLAMGVGIFFINHGLNNWLPEILTGKGLTTEQAGVWASIPTIVGVIGSLVIPRYAPASWRFKTVIILLVSTTMANLMFLTDVRWMIVIALAMQGLTRGSLMTLALLLIMEMSSTPRERTGLAGSMYFISANVGGVMGPFAFGALSDIYGSFNPALILMAALTLILSILAIITNRPAK